jgi:hypothetical protein
MWCHKYRKARARRVSDDGQASGGGDPARRSRLWLPFRGGAGRGGGERPKPAEAHVATEAPLGWLLALPLSWVLVAAPLTLL